MNKKQRFYLVLLAISLLYVVYLIGSLYMDGRVFYPKSYGMNMFLLGLTSAVIVLLIILFCLDTFSLYKRIGLFSLHLHIVEVVLFAVVIVLVAALGEVMVYQYTRSSETQDIQFSIGIYQSDSEEPLYFSGEQVNNPVLTRADVSDIKAEFIADPFLLYENGTFYLFFEVFNTVTSTGDIGLAESEDAIHWTYRQIILDEPFHLSYPCVFQYNNEYYMIPETGETRSVRLYKALDFPLSWTYEKTLIDGQYLADSTIFYYNDTWWLFTESFPDSTLYLYYADSPLDNWKEHPQNPIVYQDANISRPAGNVVVLNDRIFRYTQDDYPTYGSQVWVFQVTALTRAVYIEERIGSIPLLKGYDNWNELGMHHISICKINDHWIAAVDGKGIP